MIREGARVIKLQGSGLGNDLKISPKDDNNEKVRQIPGTRGQNVRGCLSSRMLFSLVIISIIRSVINM